MKFEKESCPLCSEGQWVPYSDGTHTFLHKNKERNVPGMNYAKCDHCGTRGFIKGQIALNKRLISAFEDSLHDYISPSNILKIREIYDISQKDAARIFNCGPTQFSKWERGIVAPTGPTAILLKKVISNSSLMADLAKDANVTVRMPSNKKTASDFDATFTTDSLRSLMDKQVTKALKTKPTSTSMVVNLTKGIQIVRKSVEEYTWQNP